ncbi:MAG: retropepsin-like aspartic protease [Thermoanaerobaculia bacterium]
MKIRLEGGLLYVSAELVYRAQKLTLSEVILDTGSAGTLFSADEAVKLGLVPEPNDPLRRVRGVGGSEFVFSKRLDSLSLGDLSLSSFPIQIGAMDYGFPIQGLIGLDFLMQARAVIDLSGLEIYAPH